MEKPFKTECTKYADVTPQTFTNGPINVNKNAEKYAALAAFMAYGNPAVRKGENPDEWIFSTILLGREKYGFSLKNEDLEEISITLPGLLENLFLQTQPFDTNFADDLVVYLKHMFSPGRCVKSLNSEIGKKNKYLREISYLEKIDQEARTIDIVAETYDLSTQKFSAYAFDTCGMTFNFNEMENAYPGFMERALIAIDLGLKHNELLEAALASGDLFTAEDRTLSLPILSSTGVENS